MVTIRDVAKKVGCSISTVSYALNGDNRISAETRDKILQVASELDYYPMSAARALKSKKNFTIGIVAISYLSPVFNELLDSITDSLEKNGYNALTTTNANTVAKMVTERFVDGLIVADAVIDVDLIKRAARASLPVCFLNQFIEGENITTSIQNNKLSMYNMTKLMLDKGCKSIAYLNGHPDSFDNGQRFDGYVSFCEEKNIPLNVLDGNFTIKSGYLAGKKMIEQGKIFDAIVCANDEMCVGLLEALREHKIFAPKDLYVSGYDNIELSRYYSPHITTVAINRKEWGETAANRIFKMINGVSIKKNVTISGRILERESTGGNASLI